MSQFTIDIRTEKNVLGPLADGLPADLRKILRVGGLSIERRAKERVHVITGNLRASIGTDFSGLNALEVRVGATAEYAPAEEFGTVFRPAHPYLTPSLEEEGPKVAQAVLERLRRG